MLDPVDRHDKVREVAADLDPLRMMVGVDPDAYGRGTADPPSVTGLPRTRTRAGA
jgi:hypothetical protein